jgi:hypothetical protein
MAEAVESVKLKGQAISLAPPPWNQGQGWMRSVRAMPPRAGRPVNAKSRLFLTV